MAVLKCRHKYEESENAYGFNKKLLKSPTSVTMLSSVMIKDIDKKSMEAKYQLLKRKQTMS